MSNITLLPLPTLAERHRYSILMGEQVAIDYLLDLIYSYQENFDITITKIDGSPNHLKNF